ncbi:kinase-like protein, partial [Patellaria atrata CBS 101060]
PYLLIRNLASSSKAVIDVVKDVITEAVYVRKTIRHAQPQNHSQIEQYMRNEVVAMRYMSVHRHFVALHATYVQRGELSLIVDPVANQGDLGSFLQHIKASERPPNESQKNILLSAFGCLANGLDFMHHQTIRHKIIDPQSIFIHFDRVLYTNFGLSFDFGTAGNISSSGPLEGLNLRYAAPEVRQWGQGDRKSDVFSLACVYVEILTAL